MSNQTNSLSKGLTVKDLVTTGIFTALVFVFVLIGGIFFAPNPVLTFFMPSGSGLLAGPVFLLMIAKVQKRWSLSIMGVVICIIWFVTGMHWAFALGYLIMAVVADFVAGAGQYKSKKLNSLAYILFSLGGTGSYIVFFADPNGWAQTMLGNGTEHSYIDTMQATANTGILIAMCADVYKRQIKALLSFWGQGFIILHGFHIKRTSIPSQQDTLYPLNKQERKLSLIHILKNYSYTVVDGAVYYRENSRMVRPDLNATAEARVKGLVGLPPRSRTAYTDFWYHRRLSSGNCPNR